MDAITQCERERERGKEKNYKRRKGIGGKRENKRRAINWRLACVFGRQKISLIPCSSFPLWICQWRVLVKSSWWFPHPLLLRRRGMIAVTLISTFFLGRVASSCLAQKQHNPFVVLNYRKQKLGSACHMYCVFMRFPQRGSMLLD